MPPRVLLAWGLLTGGTAAAFCLRPWLDQDAWLIVFFVAWMVTGKTATLLCLDPDVRRRLTWGRFLAYLVFPGMNPRQFLPERKPSPGDVRPTVPGFLINLAAAVLFLYAIPALMPEGTPLFVRFWSGLVGASLLTFFARFDGLVLIFRWFGVAAEKAWYFPVGATSLGDFWGRRWNRVMSDLLRDVLFLPLSRRAGAAAAMFAVFLYSGLFHEVVSVAVGSGYGGPTLYFLLQGAGVWVEGRRGFRRVLRDRPWLGRLWTGFVVLAPLGLVLHRGFVNGVLVPMLADMGVPGMAS